MQKSSTIEAGQSRFWRIKTPAPPRPVPRSGDISAYEKAVWKKIFEDDFSALGLLQAGVTNLQEGAGIEDLFASVLDDPQINYRRYVN